MRKSKINPSKRYQEKGIVPFLEVSDPIITKIVNRHYSVSVTVTRKYHVKKRRKKDK